jgi:hypothetical protein
MSGGARSSEHLSARGGRHRRGNAGTWTPGVSGTMPLSRHASAGGLVDPPARGLLPISPSGSDDEPGFPPARGELPVPRRTKVTLAPIEQPEPDDTDVVVHTVPPASGLGTFDLGSVPASVTPPRSWRRAAWFATASSGGVVVALLFAGSALVGKPLPEQTALGWVPGLGGGGRPILEDGQQPPPPAPGSGQSTASAARTRGEEPTAGSESATSPVQPVADPYRPTHEMPAGAPTSSLAPPSTVTPVAPPRPPTPPPGEAPYDADPFRVGLPQAAPAVLAENSQKFFYTVVEDPEAAHAMTTGKLQREGAGALARKYADVAYFEVEHVQVHQYEGKTVCTVRTVHKDGTRTVDKRVLTFSHGKIDSAD